MPVSIQTLYDSNQRTVVKVIGNGTDIANTTILNTESLVGAKSGLTSWLVNIKRITYSVNGGYVSLYWQGASTNTPIINLANTGTIEFTPDNMVLKNDATSPSGNIGIFSVNQTTNSNFSIILDLKKEPEYFDTGVIV